MAAANTQASPGVLLLGGLVDNRKDRIVSYWTKRSEDFAGQRQRELHNEISSRWLSEFHKYFPSDKKLNILDVGCGSGFFGILLAGEGHHVTGIDLTPDMIAQAKKLADREGQKSCSKDLNFQNHTSEKKSLSFGKCDFQVMDAENLAFANDSFDAVISRNLTWTLPHAERAYSEWLRVLKPGGILLNFDADYGCEKLSQDKSLPKNHAHAKMGEDMFLECERIKEQLPISKRRRPFWDLGILTSLGVQKFHLDLGTGSRIYQKIDEFYNPTPIFTLCAVKA